jgi:hypothetical protein
MEITITIPDAQWQEFQQLSQEAVEKTWDGSYEDFATYIMTVNIDTYIESQKRKQEKQMKRALAEYEVSLRKEQNALTTSAGPAPSPPVAKKPEDKTKTTSMTNKELSARIAELQAITVKKRTLAEVNELNNLLRMRKSKTKKK